MRLVMGSWQHRQQGIGLIEILITLLVISLGVLAHVTFQRFAFHSATLATGRAAATEIALNKLEDLRSFTTVKTAAGQFAFQDIADDTGGTLPASDNVVVGNTTYTRHWQVTNYWYTQADSGPVTTAPTGHPVPDLKRVTVHITWTDIDGKPQALDLYSLIAGIDPASGGHIYQ